MLLDDSTIDTILDYLETTEAKRASLFGSYARGEGDNASDVDLLVEFEPAISLLTFVRYKRELEKLTGKKIDMLTPASISSYIFPSIEKDLKLIYERK